jgi:Protein of unknown function (DUF1592)/Protein of unknown function (DUF1588)/Protein of unknown function (DUF1587)/Protein of unknown function (DUF1585)/Protein of unknown function (DUF1595)
MTRSLALSLGIAVATVAAAWLFVSQRHRSMDAEGAWATIDRYCMDCHNDSEYTGDLSFDAIRHDEFAAAAPVWEHAIRKLRGGFMPPPGQPRPPGDGASELAAWLETTLDAAAREDPHPGAPALHRLNRAEYANAVRDLLDMPVDATALLPADDSSAGFDNIASALSISPSLLQAYTAAAAKISRMAVGDSTISPGQTTYSVPRDVSQDDHVAGLPFGTRGGLLVDHVFPLTAEYEIRVNVSGAGFGLRSVGRDPVVVTLNGEEAAVIGARDGNSATLHIAAGAHTIGAAMIPSAQERGVDDIYSWLSPASGVSSISIMGPLDPTGPGETRSRQRLFVCHPETADDEVSCAREILSTLATRAYRRPVNAEDRAVERLLGFFEEGRALRGFELGIQYALARVLVDPEFIFRFEHEPGDSPAGTVYALNDYELASRLSFFLWSSIPDDELLRVAAEGGLDNPDVRAAQVRRMLADDRANALVDNFASQWFGLRELETVLPETNTFDGNLRHAFRRETELLFEDLLHNDLSIVELLDADYTYVDERLARHYGIPNIRGSRFRRVSLEGTGRTGVLGHGSVLTVTSAPNRTSPVSRGAWVLENILGSPPPAPPENVERDLAPTAASGPDATSLRQRLEQHRADPGCASCHQLMDPLGLALENFDLIGQWRETDGARPVDASTTLWDGTHIDGLTELNAALLDRREIFVTHATEKLLTYALGRSLEATDMPFVREIVRGAKDDEYRFSALILGIVESVPFRMREKVAPADELVAAGLERG